MNVSVSNAKVLQHRALRMAASLELRAMKHRRVSSFIDDVLANRRPRRFRASDADTEILRTAIRMQAARPGECGPDQQFVDNLRKGVALQVVAASRAACPPHGPEALSTSRLESLLL